MRTDRVNAPYPQSPPLTFAALCAFGVLLAVRGMLTLRPGTEPWWTGFVAIVLFVSLFVSIDGAWLWIQREVTVSDDSIVVRRWSDVIRGAAGRTVLIDSEVRARLILDALGSLRIDRAGEKDIQFTVGYWPEPKIRELLAALRSHAVPLEIDSPMYKE